MGNLEKYPNDQGSSDPDRTTAILPKSEILDFETMYPRQHMDEAASSSGSDLRSFFTGMGFLPSLVDKVIEENGEDNVNLLLEILIEHSDPQNSKSQTSDSLDSLFDDKDANSPPEYSTVIHPKQEPDVFDGKDDDKRASLLKMNFSINEVEFAMDKLGEDASVGEIVDFITATQISENLERKTDDAHDGDAKIVERQDCNNETLFGTMEKTLRLLELGFSENEVSSAIERFGAEVPITELAESICADQLGETYVKKEKYSSQDININGSYIARESRIFNMGMENVRRNESVSQLRVVNRRETYKGKRPKEEGIEDYLGTHCSNVSLEDNYKGKRPKQEYAADCISYFEPAWEDEKVDPNITAFGMPRASNSSLCKSIDRMVAKPPYFFYGNVVTVSFDVWGKISQFLYAIEPEFVNAQIFSALSRREGYIHNLPTENRFHILPKPPTTLRDAIPNTKKWWPSWDTRKQLSYINSETSGVSEVCDRLGRILIESRGLLSSGQKRDIVHQCQMSSLMWVGPNRLGPIEPEHLEYILGYPINHTEVAEISLTERMYSLGCSFQIDTLGYHLSVLKNMFPGGITMLSVFSGIGGAEVALHRLGIHLKGVVSVETCEIKRRILRNWWHISGQTGQLEQIDDIQKLTGNRIEKLVDKFGDFDLVVCQNSCSQSSKGPKNSPDGFDFTLFYEFVRVLQRVRSRIRNS